MRVIALIVRAGAVVVAAGFLFSLVVDGGDEPVVTAQSEPAPAETTPPPKPTAAAAEPKAPPGVVTIAATGDIDMGSAPNGGRSLFSDVQADLAGDVVLGNLEGTLSSEGTPPAYAARLLDAGLHRDEPRERPHVRLRLERAAADDRRRSTPPGCCTRAARAR